MTTTTVNFRFTDADLQRLEGIATFLGITRTEVIRRSLVAYMTVLRAAPPDYLAPYGNPYAAGQDAEK